MSLERVRGPGLDLPQVRSPQLPPKTLAQSPCVRDVGREAAGLGEPGAGREKLGQSLLALVLTLLNLFAPKEPRFPAMCQSGAGLCRLPSKG